MAWRGGSKLANTAHRTFQEPMRCCVGRRQELRFRKSFRRTHSQGREQNAGRGELASRWTRAARLFCWDDQLSQGDLADQHEIPQCSVDGVCWHAEEAHKLAAGNLAVDQEGRANPVISSVTEKPTSPGTLRLGHDDAPSPLPSCSVVACIFGLSLSPWTRLPPPQTKIDIPRDRFPRERRLPWRGLSVRRRSASWSGWSGTADTKARVPGTTALCARSADPVRSPLVRGALADRRSQGISPYYTDGPAIAAANFSSGTTPRA